MSKSISSPKYSSLGSKQISVQGTNDNSMVSKHSTGSLGYYNDPYTSNFISKPSRRAPIIHWGYYIRFRAMNFMVSEFCRWIRKLGGSGGQIIVLGAGYDSAYFRLREAGLLESILFIEVDFSKVIANKQQLLQASLLSYTTLHLIGQDLRDTKSFHAKLRQVPNFDFNRPTLFISEVVLAYMNDNHSSRLIKWICLHFPNSNFLSYEQVFTHDPFGLVILKHYKQIGSKLQSVLHYETPKAQEIRFCKLGFEHSRSIDMNTFYYNYTPNLSTEILRILSLEPFDEYEEWHLKCNHYTIVLAGQGVGLDWTTYIPSPSITTSLDYKHLNHKFQIDYLTENIQLTRHSHATCYNNNSVYLYGGYGLQNKVHSRLDSLIKIDLNLENSQFSYKVSLIPIIGPGPGKLVHHSLNILPDGRLILYGGRDSPSKPNGDLYIIAPCSSGDSTWNRIAVTGEIPMPRWKHSANLEMTSSNISLIIHGGVTTEGQVLNDTWRYDILSSSWTKLTTNSNSNIINKITVHSHSSVVWKERLVLYGGLTRDLLPSDSVLTLSYEDAGIGEWQEMEIEPSLPFRYGHSAVINDSVMYVIGGIELHSPCYITLIAINLNKKNWICYDLCYADPNLVNVLPFNMTSEFIDQYKCILTLGGGGNCFSFGTHINPSPFLININQLSFVT